MFTLDTHKIAKFLNSTTGIITSAVVAILLVLVFIVAVASFMRYMSSITLITKVTSPRPGVECVTWVTSDGIAGNCWKNSDLPKWEIKD